MDRDNGNDTGSSDQPKSWFNKNRATRRMMIGAFIILLSTFSVPLWHTNNYRMDMARVDFSGPNLPTVAGVEAATSLSMGIWGYCVWGNSLDHVQCQRQMSYSISIIDTARNQTFHIKSSWTKDLVVHAVMAAVIAVTPFLSRINNISYITFASFFAVSAGGGAFLTDIQLPLLVKQQMKKTALDLGAKTVTPTIPIFMLIGLLTFAFGSTAYLVEYMTRYFKRWQRSLDEKIHSTESQEEQVPLLSSL